MPKHRDLGFGTYTPDKAQTFRAILSMHMVITRAVLEKARSRGFHTAPYLYLDLTAGPGFSNPEKTILGSPLIFLDLATRPLHKGRSEETFPPVPFEAHFFEKDVVFANELKSNITDYLNALTQSPIDFEYYLHPIDYADQNQGVLAMLQQWGYQKYRYGLVYIDPSGNIPDFELLARIPDLLPRIEILLHIAATPIKRRAQAHNAERLEDFLNKFPKDYWLIRDPLQGDNYQWTFLMGSSAVNPKKNTPLFRGLKSQKFYPLNSPKGQKIFEKLHYTQRELSKLRQPFLPNFLSDEP